MANNGTYIYCDQCGEKIRSHQHNALQEGELDFCDERCRRKYVKVHRG